MVVEDLTTYYNDAYPGYLFTITSTRVTIEDLVGDRNESVRKDFGESHFDAIDLLFTFRISSLTELFGRGGLGFSNNSSRGYSTWTGDRIVIEFFRDNYDIYYVCLSEYGGPSDKCQVSVNTPYYCRLVRTAGSENATLYIYTDSSRATLHDTLTMSGLGTTKFRYLFVACGNGSGDPDAEFEGYLENFEFVLPSGGGAQIIGLELL